MKKLFFLLVILFLLSGCKTISPAPFTNERVTINESYRFSNLFRVHNNRLQINRFYFTHDFTFLSSDDTLLLDQMSEEANQPLIYLRLPAPLIGLSNQQNLSLDYHIISSENTQVTLKLNLFALFINQNNILALNLDYKLPFTIFYEGGQSTSALIFEFFTPPQDNYEVITLDNNLRCEQYLYSVQGNDGIFILPGLDETISHYIPLVASLTQSYPQDNIHIINYPGFGQSDNVTFSTINELAAWLEKIINYYQYNQISLIGKSEGALLMRYFTHQEHVIKQYHFKYLLALNPLSELGLGYYNQNEEAYLTQEDFTNHPQIKSYYQSILTNNYENMAKRIADVAKNLASDSYFTMLQEMLNKKDYVNKKWLFNNLNLAGFIIDNKYPNYQLNNNIDYIFERASIDTSHTSFYQLYEFTNLPLKKDPNGEFYQIWKYQPGIIYVFEKDFFNHKQEHFFNNFTANMADFYFVNNIFDADEFRALINQIKIRDLFHASRYLRPCDLYNLFFLHAATNNFDELNPLNYYTYNYNLVNVSHNKEVIKALLEGIITYFCDKYNNNINVYYRLPNPYTFLNRVIINLAQSKPEHFLQTKEKLSNCRGIDLIYLVDEIKPYSRFFYEYNNKLALA